MKIITTEEGTPALVLPLGTTLAEATRQLVEATIANSTTQREAAARLGVCHKTLYNYRRKWQVEDAFKGRRRMSPSELT